MKGIKIYITFFMLLFLTGAPVYSQILPHLGWFEETQLFYNPSYAGLGDELRGTVLSRLQWKGITGSPSTNYLAMDAPLGKRVSIGGTIGNDKIGQTVENKISVDGSYRVYVSSKSFFQTGLKVGVSHISSKYSKLSQWDENDPLKEDINVGVLRLGFGLTYKTPKFYVGAAIPGYYSTNPNNVFSDASNIRYMRRNYFFTAGTHFEISEYITFVPSTLIRYYEKRAVNFILNLGLELNQTVQIGVSYVHPSIYGVYGKVALTPRVKFGYRHEFSPSVISVGTFGTGEFLLTYGFN